MGRSRSSFHGLKDGYVFYKSLKDTHPSVYSSVSAGLSNWADPQRKTGISEKLRAMAQIERQKEKNFLSDIFGFDVTYDINNKNFEKDFFQALNKALQLKGIYDRHKARFTNAGGTQNWNAAKNTSAAYFGKYLNDAFEESKAGIANAITSSLISSGNYEAISQTLENYLTSTVLPRAIQLYSEIKVFRDAEDKEEYGSYKEIYDAIMSFSNASGQNPILNQIYDLYLGDRVKELINGLKEDSKKNKTKIKKLRRKDLGKLKVAEKNYTKGGNLQELLTGAVADAATGINNTFSTTNGNVTLTWKTAFTGHKGLKDDMVYIFNVDPSEVEKALNELEYTEKTSRASNVTAMNNMLSRLDGIEEGYVVHVNAKDYVNKMEKGFSAGEAVTLKNLKSTFDIGGGSPPVDFDQMIAQIAQLEIGAIGDKYMAEARESVAACAAYMLFDDFETIGNEVAGAPGVVGNQIHLFYLNGFYVTLSILLDRLANAFSEINQQIPTSLVNVRIRNGKIQFPSPDEWGEGKWEIQKNYTLNHTTIEMRFLKNINEFLNDVV